MSLITAIVNITEISYWCLYLAVITNIPSTSFWCNIPKLAYISALETSKCDNFDVTSQLTVAKTSFWCLYSTVHINVTKTSKWYHNRIVIVRLQKLIWCIILTSFWCDIPTLTDMSTLWTSQCDHFDVTYNRHYQRL